MAQDAWNGRGKPRSPWLPCRLSTSSPIRFPRRRRNRSSGSTISSTMDACQIRGAGVGDMIRDSMRNSTLMAQVGGMMRGRNGQSDDRLYDAGHRALDNHKYDEALECFNQVASHAGCARRCGLVLQGVHPQQAGPPRRSPGRHRRAAQILRLQPLAGRCQGARARSQAGLRAARIARSRIGRRAQADGHQLHHAVRSRPRHSPAGEYPEKLAAAQGEGPCAVCPRPEQRPARATGDRTDRPRRRQSRPPVEGHQLPEPAAQAGHRQPQSPARRSMARPTMST